MIILWSINVQNFCILQYKWPWNILNDRIKRWVTNLLLLYAHLVGFFLVIHSNWCIAYFLLFHHHIDTYYLFQRPLPIPILSLRTLICSYTGNLNPWRKIILKIRTWLMYNSQFFYYAFHTIQRNIQSWCSFELMSIFSPVIFLLC